MDKLKNILFICLFGLFSTTSAIAKPILSLGTSYYEPITTAEKDGVFDLIYAELSRRLGVAITIDRLETAERVLVNANSGLSDGDVGRIAGLDKEYPNLIRVPIPIYHFEMAVFTKNVNFKVDGKKSIMPYHIGLLRGWKILERISTGARSVTSLERADQVFTMLDKGRIDIALFEKSQASPVLKRMGLKEIKPLTPNLLEGDWYLYLNKKHQAMIPKIVDELTKMYNDGTIERINKQVKQRYAI